MEIVALRYVAVQKALVTLGEGLIELENFGTNTSKIYTLMRDGIIQRFEYCIDSFWKFLKIYLETDRTMSIESPSPRVILRLSLTMQLIYQEECDILLDCVSDRNLTSHSYNEEMAEKIQSHIPLYYEIMKHIVERLHIAKN